MRTPDDGAWARHLAELDDFIAEHRHTRVPTTDQRGLGAWVAAVRRARRGTGPMTLTPQRIAELDARGFVWSVRQRPTPLDWTERLAELDAFIAEHGHARVPQADRGLGNWVRSVRAARVGRGTYRLTPQRIADLDARGFLWSSDLARHRDQEWEQRIGLLREFVSEHGHTRVPRRHPALGEWARSVRRSRLGATDVRLTADRIAQLDALGFEWNR